MFLLVLPSALSYYFSKIGARKYIWKGKLRDANLPSQGLDQKWTAVLHNTHIELLYYLFWQHKRDTSKMTKYVELVIVADNREVRNKYLTAFPFFVCFFFFTVWPRKTKACFMGHKLVFNQMEVLDSKLNYQRTLNDSQDTLNIYFDQKAHSVCLYKAFI